MQTSSSGGYVDFARFSALRHQATDDQAGALEKIADEFEALFVDLMLKSARDAEIKGGLFDSQAMSTYREMFDQQIAMTMATQNDLGIGRALARQFEANLAPTQDAQGKSDLNGELRRYYGPLSTRLDPAAPGTTQDDDGRDPREQFQRRLSPYAQQAGEILDVPPRAILAQAALETGWGQHTMQREDGRSSHNYFGIKAGPQWSGDTVNVRTTEYIGGRAVTVDAAFRAYETPLEAFRDYIDFLQQNPRYRDVVASGNSAARFANALADAGYATDPKYAEKIIAIVESEHWNNDSATTTGETRP